MNRQEAVKRACQEPSLSEALSWIAIWETDRAVRQALATGGLYETCFKVCFDEVLETFPGNSQDDANEVEIVECVRARDQAFTESTTKDRRR